MQTIDPDKLETVTGGRVNPRRVKQTVSTAARVWDKAQNIMNTVGTVAFVAELGQMGVQGVAGAYDWWKNRGKATPPAAPKQPLEE